MYAITFAFNFTEGLQTRKYADAIGQNCEMGGELARKSPKKGFKKSAHITRNLKNIKRIPLIFH